MPAILFRYLITQSLFRSFQLLVVFVLLYTAIDYVETASLVSSQRLYAVYFYKLPQIVSHVLPLVLAMGSVLAANRIKQQGEWTAFEAGGVPPYVMLTVLWLPAALLMPVGWFLVHQWSPQAMKAFDDGVRDTNEPVSTYGRSGNWLIFRSDSTHPTREFHLLRDARGRVQQLRVRDTQKEQWLTQWHVRADAPEDNTAVNMPGPLIRLPAIGINGIFGDQVTSESLVQHATYFIHQGIPAHRMTATVTMRHGMVMTLGCVPLLTLLAWWMLGIAGTLRAVFIALGTTAAYWVSLLIWWNLAQNGWIPAWSIVLSMGGGTLLLLGGVAAIRSRPN